MIRRQIEAWKKFIRRRIAQEQGRDEEGLSVIAQALEIDPDNKYFRDASEIAQRNLRRDLSRSEEEHLAHVTASYQQLAQDPQPEK